MSSINNLPPYAVIAHRGASAFAPENTLSAFRAALKAGAHGIELDAKRSADGLVVVMHDPTVNRTTDGMGYVHQLKAAELTKLDAGAKFHPDFSGERVPRLEDVFEEIGKKILINIELTNYISFGDGLPEAVAELVRRHNIVEWVFFSSFDPRNLRLIRKHLPAAPCAMLSLPGWKGMAARGWVGMWAGPDALNPWHQDVSERLVQKENARRRKVITWTVNGIEDLRTQKKLGVDAVITDDPARALAVREETSK